LGEKNWFLKKGDLGGGTSFQARQFGGAKNGGRTDRGDVGTTGGEKPNRMGGRWGHLSWGGEAVGGGYENQKEKKKSGTQSVTGDPCTKQSWGHKKKRDNPWCGIQGKHGKRPKKKNNWVPQEIFSQRNPTGCCGTSKRGGEPGPVQSGRKKKKGGGGLRLIHLRSRERKSGKQKRVSSKRGSGRKSENGGGEKRGGGIKTGVKKSKGWKKRRA